MSFLRVATLLPLILLACEIEAAPRKANRCYAVRIDAISSSPESSVRRRFRRQFSAEEILDLRFSVWLDKKDTAGLVEIKLYTPEGRLYQILPASADADVAARSRRRRVVSARLPVAGSHVTRRSLYGKWRAEVFLDGSEQPCRRRAEAFVIEP